MKQHFINSDLSAILSFVDDEFVSIDALASGSSSEVWKVTGKRHEYALLLASNKPARCGINIDISIRNLLANLGAAVARPIVSSLELPNTNIEHEWVLDEFISGNSPDRKKLDNSSAVDLGRALAMLHDIPASCFGTPTEPKAGHFAGSKKDALAGIYQRFDNPLPFLSAEMAKHPLFETAPELAIKLQPAIKNIRKEISNSSGVICHSDLHNLQFICGNNRLSALIDFGEACIMDYRWDFGSLLYFHGAKVLENTLNGYTKSITRRREIFKSAHLFSAGIALHHSSRSRLPGKHHRFEVATNYLENLLPKIT